jgi:outer membrane protein insertion porin family
MEGAWYDDDRIKLSKQRIDKTDYFSEVTVETQPIPGTTDQVDVNFGVTEKTTGNITLGAGYSQTEKVILSGSISQANIFGSGRYASIQVSTGKLNRAIGFSYNNPYFTVDGISQGFDVYHRKFDPTDSSYEDTYRYKTVSTGGGIRFGIPISENQAINFGVAVDYTKVTIDKAKGSPWQYMRFVKNFCGESAEACGNLSVPLTVGWVSDYRNSAINPTQGTYQRATLELSPGGDLRYYKLNYQHQRYFPVTRNLTLMLNGEAGYAKGLGGQDLPFFKNFYAGGIGSVRGWDAGSLGPYEIDQYGDEVYLGGTRRLIFNAELSMPVPGFGADKSFRFGPFFDAGQVYSDEKASAECQMIGSERERVCDEGPIRMSVGLAATWLSPLGPLKFSFAYPLNRQRNDTIQRFQFQMGTVF